MRYMILTIVILMTAILVAEAYADEPHYPQQDYLTWGTSEGLPEVWYTEPEDETVSYGIITHYNQNYGHYNLTTENMTFETPYGLVTVQVRRTYNRDCSPVPCPDTIEVMSTPDGVRAYPWSITTEESEFGFITLFPDLLG